MHSWAEIVSSHAEKYSGSITRDMLVGSLGLGNIYTTFQGSAYSCSQEFTIFSESSSVRQKVLFTLQ